MPELLKMPAPRANLCVWCSKPTNYYMTVLTQGGVPICPQVCPTDYAAFLREEAEELMREKSRG